MAESISEPKVSFPYMTSGQWTLIRSRLRQSVPKAVDVDWLMAALGTSNKGAQNLMPQLRAIGLIDADGGPSDLAMDIRDDESYGEACARILASLYPQSLRDAYDNPETDPADVARWFMRNARTGEVTAKMQARLYLLLLGGQPPEPIDPKANGATSRRAPAATKPSVEKKAPQSAPPAEPREPAVATVGLQAPPAMLGGPTLHIDLQIHIGADSSDAQIEAVFKSMAKHLYGKE